MDNLSIGRECSEVRRGRFKELIFKSIADESDNSLVVKQVTDTSSNWQHKVY